MRRYSQFHRRKIQDRFHTRIDHPVDDTLRYISGHGNDRDVDLVAAQRIIQLRIMTDQQTVPTLSYFCHIGIENRFDVEALAAEILVSEERCADLARADQRHPPAALQPENRLESPDQLRDAVPQPAFPERAEKRKILPHLRRASAALDSELLAGQRGDAVVVELFEASEVDGQAPNGGFRDLLHAT